MGNFIDLTGQRFGQLTAIKRVKDDDGKNKWLCRCDCGDTKLVLAGHLRGGGILNLVDALQFQICKKN